MIAIELEDRGQDFTTWICDDHGEVVDAQPFQGWLWKGCKVIGAADLRRGDVVDYLDHEGHIRTLKYRVNTVCTGYVHA